MAGQPETDGEMAATAETMTAAASDRLAEIDGLRRRGRLGEAMAACEELLRHAPENIRLLLLAAAITRDGQHYIRSSAYLDRVVAARPTRAADFCETARIWRQCGNKAGALDAYRDALRLDPAQAAAHVDLAEIQAEDDENEEAIYHLKIAVAVEPERLDARERLAVLLDATGEGAQAMALRQETMRRARRQINAEYMRIRTPAVSASPRVMQRHRLAWAHALLVYGTSAVGVARFQEESGSGIDAAAETYRDGLTVLAEAADQARSVSGLRRAFATASLAFSRCHFEMALLQERRGDPGAAIHHLEEALRAHGSPWDEVYEKLGALVEGQKMAIGRLRDLVAVYTGQASAPAGYPVSRWNLARHASGWLSWVGKARAVLATKAGRHIALLAARPEELQLCLAIACVLMARGHRVDLLWWPGLRFEGDGDPDAVFGCWDETLMAGEMAALAALGLPEDLRLVDLRDLTPAAADDAMEREAERLAMLDAMRQGETGTIYATGRPVLVQRQNRTLRNLQAMRRLAAYVAETPFHHLIVMNGDMMESAGTFWVARRAKRTVIAWNRCRDRSSAITISCNRTRADCDFAALWQSDEPHTLAAQRRERVLSWLSGRTGGDFRVVEPRKRHLPTKKALTALAEHGLDPARPVAVLFGDRASAGVTSDGLVFGDAKNWIARNVEWFEQHPDWQLVIRLYPQDGPTGVRSALRERWPELPRNIRILESSDAKLDYHLLELAQLGVYRINPIGLEMAMMGIIAIAAGRPFFANKGFTQEARDEDDYFRLVRRALDGPEAAAMTDREIELAWCFADVYLHVAPKPFPWSDRYFWRDIEECPMSRLLTAEGEARFGWAFAAFAGDFTFRDGVVGTID
jgi:tetratricopeptide (TPR) repeat protein